MISPYEALANAIVVQACKDYRDDLVWLSMHSPVTEDDKENEKYANHLADKGSIEAFFRSQWFQVLSDLDGEYLIRRIREEFAANDKQRVFESGIPA